MLGYPCTWTWTGRDRSTEGRLHVALPDKQLLRQSCSTDRPSILWQQRLEISRVARLTCRRAACGSRPALVDLRDSMVSHDPLPPARPACTAPAAGTGPRRCCHLHIHSSSQCAVGENGLILFSQHIKIELHNVWLRFQYGYTRQQIRSELKWSGLGRNQN
jgi:hypothetical protein